MEDRFVLSACLFFQSQKQVCIILLLSNEREGYIGEYDDEHRSGFDDGWAHVIACP